jgi:hypothetical protein
VTTPPAAPRRPFAVALVHWPVHDAERAIVTSAITNLDVHDLARSARTYGASDYFLVHPIDAQRALVDRIRTHWLEGSSGRRIPDRIEAIKLVRPVPSLEAAFDALGGRAACEVWVTAARKLEVPRLSFAAARARLVAPDAGSARKPVLILFGTAWGLADSVIAGADAALPPIRASADTGYNHLSVRAACAIMLDRLLGASDA